MMARQLLLVSLALVLALVAGSAEALRSMPDCKNVPAVPSIANLEVYCPEIFSDKELNAGIKKFGESLLVRFDTVELCACGLMKHEFIWASIMTKELDMLYEALKQFIDARVQDQKKIEEDEGPKRETRVGRKEVIKEATMKDLLDGPASKVLFEGEEGQRRFYWDAIEPILRSAKEKYDHELIYKEISQNFANLYYDKDFKLVFLYRADGMDTRTAINGACDRVIEGFFKTFLPMFDRLSVMAGGNKRLLYTLTRYDEDLYKLRMTGLLCEYLQFAGQVLSG